MKAESSLRKHSISFRQAIQIFDDPYVISEQDRLVDGELRWQSVGMVAGVVLLLVAHTVTELGGEEIIRVISAREAKKLNAVLREAMLKDVEVERKRA